LPCSALDAVEKGPRRYKGQLKIQLAGSWTLPVTIEQSRSLNLALADPGPVVDAQYRYDVLDSPTISDASTTRASAH